MKHPATVTDIVNLWPTRAALASDLSSLQDGLRASAGQVHKWAKFGSIPAKYHRDVIRAARLRHLPVTAELLVELHAVRVGDKERGAA